MLSRMALLWLGLVAVAGCGAYAHDGTLRPPDRRAMVRLERQAQREMHCRSPLRVVALEARAYQVDGCGQMREYAWVCPGRRCAFQPIVPALVRASADLQCAPAQLTGAADRPNHRAFFGCMRGAAYTLMCLDHGCTWSRTQEAVTVAGAPTPQPPTVTVGQSPTVPVATGSVADPTLAEVAIPPPPGATSAFAPTPPSSAPPPAPPPPPSTASPSDSIVIPPPPS